MFFTVTFVGKEHAQDIIDIGSRCGAVLFVYRSWVAPLEVEMGIADEQAEKMAAAWKALPYVKDIKISE